MSKTEGDIPIEPAKPETSDSTGAYQVLLDHLTRCFEAEEENARRLRDNTKTLVTAIVAFLAVGLFRFGLSLTPDSLPSPLWVRLLIVGLLLAAIGCFIWASTFLVVKIRTERRKAYINHIREVKAVGAASLLMFPDSQDIDDLTEPLPGTAAYVLFKASGKTLAAAATLARRNSTRETEISLGRQWFGYGVLAISAAVMLHVVIWGYNPGLDEELRAAGGSEAETGRTGSGIDASPKPLNDSKEVLNGHQQESNANEDRQDTQKPGRDEGNSNGA